MPTWTLVVLWTAAAYVGDTTHRAMTVPGYTTLDRCNVAKSAINDELTKDGATAHILFCVRVD